MSSNPYASPQHGGETPRPLEFGRPLEYVGFWLRVVASIVDSILLGIVIYPILGALYGWDYFLFKEGEVPVRGAGQLLINQVLPGVIIILFWVYKSATPGKMLIGAEIVDADTLERPTTGQCVIRYLGYILSSMVCLLGFIWVAFDEKKQGWHDKMARTIVIRR